MFSRFQRFYTSIKVAADVVMLTVAFALAYATRFEGPIPVLYGLPEWRETLLSLVTVLLVFPFTYSQARKLGLSDWSLCRLRDEHLIEPLGRGLYERADLADGDHDLRAVAARAPRATLCLRSALARHGLIDDIPAEIDIALPRGTRTPALDAPISWHSFDTATFDLGRGTLDLGAGQTIGLYSPERCIADAFRLAGTEGPELGNEARHQRKRLVTVARVGVHLSAAGLAGREDHGVTQPFEHANHGPSRLRKEGVVVARDEE